MRVLIDVTGVARIASDVIASESEVVVVVEMVTIRSPAHHLTSQPHRRSNVFTARSTSSWIAWGPDAGSVRSRMTRSRARPVHW